MIGFVNKWTVVDMLTAFENEFQRHKPFSDTENAMYWRLCEIEGDIGKLPSADLVEVVRCKDCADRDEEPCDDNLLWCNRIGNAVLPFGYCSDGIRRLGNE